MWGLAAISSLATAAPTLTPHRDYVAQTTHLRIAFISHGTTVIDLAPAGAGGSQYDEGHILLNCPAVSKDALVAPGFGKITLKRGKENLSFSISYSAKNVYAGYPGEGVTTLGSVKVHLTGTVTSASVITGTVQMTGKPCTTPTYTYSAKIDPADTKYIAPDA
jgi:hypothetical protein